jgi:hypothetical protein
MQETSARNAQKKTAAVPTTLDAKVVAKFWSITTWGLYEAVRKGHPLPVQPLRVGLRGLKWPTGPVLASVGLDPATMPEWAMGDDAGGDGDAS